MTVLVGISGKKGSGKTSVAEGAIARLKLRGVTAARRSFARRLKELCRELFGVPDEILFGDDAAKNRVVCHDWSGREIMQHVGQAMREIDPEVWVRREIDDARRSGLDVVFFDDPRHVNEADAMDRTVRLERWNGVVDTHVSETALDDYPFDHRIPGDGTLADAVSELTNYVEEVLRG